MDDTTNRFLDQLDHFASALDARGQAMLRVLIGGDDEAAGFVMEAAWPGARSLVPTFKIGTLHSVGGQIANGDLGSGRTGGVRDEDLISGTDLGSSRADKA